MSGRVPNRRRIGTVEEQAAERFLEQHGVRITDRNFHDGRRGEIDLIGYDGPALVFFEVKYRSTGRCGSPEEAVTPAKQKTICRTARFYMTQRGIPQDRSMRFDVVAIRPGGPGRLAIHWVRNAFAWCL